MEEAGFTSIMAAYADLYVVLKTLFSNWTHATDCTSPSPSAIIVCSA